MGPAINYKLAKIKIYKKKSMDVLHALRIYKIKSLLLESIVLLFFLTDTGGTSSSCRSLRGIA